MIQRSHWGYKGGDNKGRSAQGTHAAVEGWWRWNGSEKKYGDDGRGPLHRATAITPCMFCEIDERLLEICGARPMPANPASLLLRAPGSKNPCVVSFSLSLCDRYYFQYTSESSRVLPLAYRGFYPGAAARCEALTGRAVLRSATLPGRLMIWSRFAIFHFPFPLGLGVGSQRIQIRHQTGHADAVDAVGRGRCEIRPRRRLDVHSLHLLGRVSVTAW
jgi:hypothetical protein